MNELKKNASLPLPENQAAKSKEKHSSEDYFADFDFSGLMLTPEELLKSGVHFGHQKSRKNPKMEKYIFTTRKGINIIDLKKTQEKLAEAMSFVNKVANSGKQILFIGTKSQARDVIISIANRLKMPFVVNRWLGGTFTNFRIINGRVRYLEDSEGKLERGEFKKYTKLEQSKKKEELKKLNEKLGGLRSMKEMPGAIFVVDLKDDLLSVKEAHKLNIPVIGIADTNMNPDLVDYVIPGNDDAVSSIRTILAYLGKAVEEKNIIKQSK
jgi:small subunit ribosomal protein S2